MKVLEAMLRCPGIDQTDQETGETFRILVADAQAKPKRIYAYVTKNICDDVFEHRVDLSKVTILEYQPAKGSVLVTMQGRDKPIYLPTFKPEDYMGLVDAWEQFCEWADAQGA